MDSATYLRIAVHAAKEEVHSEVGHEDGEERQNHVEVVEALTLEGSDGCRVDRQGIDHHRNECPYLLRVPAPVAAPRHVCPDGSDEDAHSEQEYCRIEQETRQCHQSFIYLRVVTAQGNDEVGDAEEEQHGKECVAEHDNHHVHGEQRRVEHRHKARNLRIALTKQCHQQDESAEHGGKTKQEREGTLQQEGEEEYRPRHELHYLESVAQWHMTGYVPT